MYERANVQQCHVPHNVQLQVAVTDRAVCKQGVKRKCSIEDKRAFGSRGFVTAAQPNVGGVAAANSPMTMIWGVWAACTVLLMMPAVEQTAMQVLDYCRCISRGVTTMVQVRAQNVFCVSGACICGRVVCHYVEQLLPSAAGMTAVRVGVHMRFAMVRE